MPAGFFLVYFRDPDDQGAVAMYIGNGIMCGVDNGGVEYSGSYQIQPNGRHVGSVNLSVRKATPLITGGILVPGQTASINFQLPPSFDNGQIFNFNLGGDPVQVRIRKLRDLP